MRGAVDRSEQATLDKHLKEQSKKPDKHFEPRLKKQIVIIDVSATTEEDALTLALGLKFSPSKTAFSRIVADLFFDDEKVRACLFRLTEGPLATDEVELKHVLDMKGVSAGLHRIRIEVYEPWSGEKVAFASKEIAVDYVPKIKEEKLIKIPTVKSVAGADLAIISESDKEIYEEIEKDQKQDAISDRDGW